ncbi:MAG: long-chain fatty acid--CoA ligase [Polyangiaceae bacterium]|nr:long-chain fatty acid--CoA ligase [Polyangiaceae bacterium]
MEPQKSFFLTDFLDRRANLTPDRVALRDAASGRAITYAAWNAAANRTANLLRSLGVGAGDRVAVYAGNCVEYLDVWMACGKIGAVLQNLNWRLTARELVHLVNDAAPRVLLYSEEFAAGVAAIRAGSPGGRHFVALGQPEAAGDVLFAAREGEPAALVGGRPELGPDAPWVICYTGGTTGLPKGAILTHLNMTWNSVNTITSWGLGPDDVAVLNAPLFHTGGLNVFTLPLVHAGGASIVCKGFDAAQAFELIERGGVTVFFGVPTMFVMMQEHPGWPSADFSRLRIVISGGAPCPAPVFEKFWAKGVDFKTGYGLTEAGPNTFWLPPGDVRRKPGSVGKPVFHVDAKVVDPAGVECAPGVPGELLVRGPHVSPGYWNDPAASAAALRDGWLHTGDLAARDDEGYYSIVGRLKDMIISGGENVYPAEVESVMHAHPAVAEAALVGKPDETWGEVGLAVVVLRPGLTLAEGELRALVARFVKP